MLRNIAAPDLSEANISNHAATKDPRARLCMRHTEPRYDLFTSKILRLLTRTALHSLSHDALLQVHHAPKQAQDALESNEEALQSTCDALQPNNDTPQPFRDALQSDHSVLPSVRHALQLNHHALQPSPYALHLNRS
ncbi:hypothetical protein GN958_ATG16262 [Phytophthora infestans]|uniref:Uncharacterized protein n=1 Tax=Phytophthora infestans TaxID=4787 RepID=A0A8S9U6S4_PHYIN|nr:hypothetical protein GN958_ATG16262 [Phytophthora infestans]